MAESPFRVESPQVANPSVAGDFISESNYNIEATYLFRLLFGQVTNCCATARLLNRIMPNELGRKLEKANLVTASRCASDGRQGPDRQGRATLWGQGGPELRKAKLRCKVVGRGHDKWPRG